MTTTMDAAAAAAADQDGAAPSLGNSATARPALLRGNGTEKEEEKGAAARSRSCRNSSNDENEGENREVEDEARHDCRRLVSSSSSPPPPPTLGAPNPSSLASSTKVVLRPPPRMSRGFGRGKGRGFFRIGVGGTGGGGPRTLATGGASSIPKGDDDDKAPPATFGKNTKKTDKNKVAPSKRAVSLSSSSLGRPHNDHRGTTNAKKGLRDDSSTSLLHDDDDDESDDEDDNEEESYGTGPSSDPSGKGEAPNGGPTRGTGAGGFVVVDATSTPTESKSGGDVVASPPLRSPSLSQPSCIGAAPSLPLRRYNSQPLPSAARGGENGTDDFGEDEYDECGLPSFLQHHHDKSSPCSSPDDVEKRNAVNAAQVPLPLPPRLSQSSSSQRSFGSRMTSNSTMSSSFSFVASSSTSSFSSLSASLTSIGGGGGAIDPTTTSLPPRGERSRPATSMGVPIAKAAPPPLRRLHHHRRNSTMTSSSFPSSQCLEASFANDDEPQGEDLASSEWGWRDRDGENYDKDDDGLPAGPPSLSRRHVRSSSIGGAAAAIASAGLCRTPIPLPPRTDDGPSTTTTTTTTHVLLRQRAHTFGGVANRLSSTTDGLRAIQDDDLTPPWSAGEFLEGHGHPMPRERKKIRPLCKLPLNDDCHDDVVRGRTARSMPIPPFSKEQLRQSQTLIHQSQQEWKRQVEASSPLTTRSLSSSCGIAGGDNVGSAMNDPNSPLSPGRSVASSSRKRTVHGEAAFASSSSSLWPPSDDGFGATDFVPVEPWSTLFGECAVRHASEGPDAAFLSLQPRSRSRAHSPTDGCLSSYDDPCEPPVGASGLTSGPQEGVYVTATRPDELQIREHVHMDLDSSDEDYDTGGGHRSNLNTSDVHETSFLEAHDNPVPSMFSPSRAHDASTRAAPNDYVMPMGVVQSAQDVLVTMPSYGDLKYIVNRMRKESVKGGIGESKGVWYVMPGRKWDASRRGAFASWAVQNLGFTLCSSGSESVMLQVTRSAGCDLLATLESSCQCHRLNVGQVLEPSVVEPAEGSFAADDAGGPSSFMDVCMSSMKRPPNVASSRSFDCILDDDLADDLAARMQSLHVAEPSNKPDLENRSCEPPSFTAIDEPLDEILPDYLSPRRLDQSPIQTFHGSVRRPPRFSSIGSRLSQGIAATVSAVVNRSSTGFAAVGPASSFELLETPLMKQDCDRWGSRPIRGRDWGKSLPCVESSRGFLLDCLQGAYRNGDLRESLGETRESLSAEKASRLQVPLCFGDEAVKPKKGPRPPAGPLIQSPPADPNEARRKRESIAKMRRLTLFYSASQADASGFIQPSGLFRERRTHCPDPVGIDEEAEFADSEVHESSALSEPILARVLSYLNESEILAKAAPVCTAWADAAALAHANLMFTGFGCDDGDDDTDSIEDLVDEDEFIEERRADHLTNSTSLSMERDWNFLNRRFPWGQYLSEGGMKKVYKVYNTSAQAVEAISVTSDFDQIEEKSMIGAELAISCLLSSFPRRGICPNFVTIHGVFSCRFDAPATRWGTQSNKTPQGNEFDPSRNVRPLKEPSKRGMFQYIRMEYCNCGDVEEFMKPKHHGALDSKVSQGIIFQVAFALHVAAERYSLKHYDMKNLNIMLQRVSLGKKASGKLVLRYGLGAHCFAVCMPSSAPLIAKLADFGTSDIKPESNGKPVTPLQFTTFENTPPDFIILGDLAKQGHGHDSFAFGLCMLHMFTGEMPYEEILDSVTCPPTLKRLLRRKVEDDREAGYSVIRSVILLDVCKDDEGNIVEGDPNGIFYDTLYRYLVLFGIPHDKFQRDKCPGVWDAIEEALEGKPVPQPGRKGGRNASAAAAKNNAKRRPAPDAPQFTKDRRQFSLAHGKNRLISRARTCLERMPGGMDLLLHLCHFDPDKRASALDVLNSRFMENLRETAPRPGGSGGRRSSSSLYSPEDDTVLTYSAFSTHGN